MYSHNGTIDFSLLFLFPSMFNISFHAKKDMTKFVVVVVCFDIKVYIVFLRRKNHQITSTVNDLALKI